MSKEISVAEAVEVLAKALAEDKTPGSYFYSWQANIAMSVMDEFQRKAFVLQGSDLYVKYHQAANAAAISFLNLFIGAGKKSDEKEERQDSNEIKLTPVIGSSNIMAIGYNETMEKMLVQFSRGQVIYSVHPVNQAEFLSFQISPSKGVHYAERFQRDVKYTILKVQ